MIQPVVEGFGEVEAFPILLRRLLAAANVHDIKIGRPIRQYRADLVREERLKRAVEMAWRQPDTTFVLVLFDADAACPAELAPQMLAWANSVRSGGCAVVAACQEYEAWFLASLPSLRGSASIRADAGFPGDPETPRGAKETLERLMESGAGYIEVVDQPRLSARMSMREAFDRSRSFRHLVTCLEGVVSASSTFAGDWPPSDWE